MKTANLITSEQLGLWWTSTPSYQNHKVGCFSTPQTMEALRDAGSELRRRGCTIAIGPMEGNTWRTHRAVIESDGSRPFPLEPVTPLELVDLLEQEGYETIARYSSSKVDLTSQSPDLSRLRERLHQVKIRPLNLLQLEDELRAIYRLSARAFRDNFLYTDISEAEFIAQYEAFRSHLNSNSAFLAERSGRLVGFVFGYPDQDRFVVKTVAVLPMRAYAGLGTVLVDKIQSSARKEGFISAIHALQREDNQSLRISKRFQATVFRRYALFAKTL
ncbi:MAG: GNAT family N-acetyltransferase [Akkermansiaceae bacterium]|nr:GNAT family N-acetyltransferase [Akkermansiaceae bacterium]